MKIQYDKKANALYIYLSSKKIVRTACVSENMNIDLDAKGSIVGIEILDISFQIPKNSLEKSIKTGVSVSV